MAVKAHALYRNPHLGKALTFSAVGHSVALMMLLVSPHWFPVPDTSASTMDAIEVQLFSAIVSGPAFSEHVSPPAREMTEDVRPSAAGPTRRAEVPEPLPTTAPVNETDSVVPPKAAPVQAAKVDRVPASDPKPPKMSVKESVDTLLAAVKADMRVPEPMAPAAPLPEAPTMAELPDTLAVLPNTTQPPEAVERVQDTVKEALKDLAVPAPLKRLVPIREGPKLAKLSEVPDMLPEAARSPATKERVREVMKEALKDVAVPSPLEQITPVPPSRKLSEPPENRASISTHAPMALARTKEQLQAVVTKALEKVELPEPVADSGPLEVAAVYPSTLPAPSVHSELKVIRERNQVLAEEHVAERQATANAQSSGPLPTMQQDAQWEKAFAEYASRVKMVIDRNWHWQGNNDLGLSVSVSFRIYPDGRATRVAISDTSGNEIFDRAAIRAVRQLKKLPRFPADIQKKFLDVVMAFSKVRAS